MPDPIEVTVHRDDDTPRDLLDATRRMVAEAFDGDFGDDDWDHTRGGWRVVVVADDLPVAHAAIVPRELHVGDGRFRAGYVEAVATCADRRGTGLGTAAMNAAGEVIAAHFELGALSTGAHHFYAQLGWERWAGPTYVRRRHELDRTEDEDDGIMVLRLGPSATIDLAAPISCEERPGDDW